MNLADELDDVLNGIVKLQKGSEEENKIKVKKLINYIESRIPVIMEKNIVHDDRNSNMNKRRKAYVKCELDILPSKLGDAELMINTLEKSLNKLSSNNKDRKRLEEMLSSYKSQVRTIEPVIKYVGARAEQSHNHLI